MDAPPPVRSTRLEGMAVRGHRRAYVLSTLMATNTTRSPLAFDMTLLGMVRHVRANALWLLNLGVCPNIAGARRRRGTRAWSKGSAHPGRPARDVSYVLSNTCPDTPMDLLLAAGARPVDFGFHWTHGPSVTVLQRQWQAWHGRASRRLWASLVQS
jgi:hypothetical protein